MVKKKYEVRKSLPKVIGRKGIGKKKQSNVKFLNNRVKSNPNISAVIININKLDS